jgi:AraC-like DNA-binding protein
VPARVASVRPPHVDHARVDTAYAESEPGARLAPVVSAVWSHGRAAGAPAAPARILPDGCADLVLAFARVGPSPAPLALAAAWVVGTMTTAHLVGAGAEVGGHAAHVGVRLRPEAAGRVLGVAAHELLDGRVPLDLLWPNPERLLAPLARVDDLAAARAWVAAALAPRLAAAAPPPAAVARAVRLFEAGGGRARVDAVSEALGVSRQHLARQFARHVGLAPKAFARVARLRALHAAVRAVERRGASAAEPGAVPFAQDGAAAAH